MKVLMGLLQLQTSPVASLELSRGHRGPERDFAAVMSLVARTSVTEMRRKERGRLCLIGGSFNCPMFGCFVKETMRIRAEKEMRLWEKLRDYSINDIFQDTYCKGIISMFRFIKT